MQIHKDMDRWLNINSLMQAMKNRNEAPEKVEKSVLRDSKIGRNARRKRNHRKVRNAIAKASRRANRCG